MIKTNFTRMQVLELMEYLDNRKDDEIFDTYQEELDYYVAEKQVNNINYTHSCTELKDKETPKIEDWLKDNFKRLDRHSFTNIHEDTVWLRSELVEVYNQLHP